MRRIMSGVAYNLSFERDGRSVKQWLIDAIAEDVATRHRAGEVLMAMSTGAPSVHTDLEGIEGELPDSHERDWRRACRDAIEQPDFPRKRFFVTVAACMIGANQEWLASIREQGDDPQYERVLARLQERVERAETEEQGEQHQRRIGRAICAAIQRECLHEQPGFEAFSMLALVMPGVVANAGPTLLEAPEAIDMLWASDSHAFAAEQALEKIGRPAAALYLDPLLEHFERSKEGRGYNAARTLASVGAGDQRTIGRLLDAMRDWPVDSVWNAASTLHAMGEPARAHHQALPVLLEMTESPDGQRRAAAACVLGAVARGLDDAVDPLLVLTRDPYADELGHGGHVVAGCAVTALGEIARQGDRVVPRLIAMLDSFHEFDPDMGYGGEHARLCGALQAFGPDEAAAAMPWLLRDLERRVKLDIDGWYGSDVLALIEHIGPAASEAVPLLEQLDAA